MKFFISLLLLILSPSLADAEITLPVSCENVTKISVDQLKSSDLLITIEGDPYIYFLTLWLKPEVAKRYNETAAQSIITEIKPDGTFIVNNPLLLLTPSGAMTSDAPYQTTINPKQLILFAKTKEKAFEAAQKVCPQIKPKVFFLYDYFEAKKRRSSKNR